MDDLSPLANIRMARLELTLEALDPIHLTGFIGPTLRGLLGTALHEVSIGADGQPAFEGPELFHEVFDMLPQPGAKPVPPPFVLHPPGGTDFALAPGDVLEFGLTLFDKALEYVPSILWALYRYGLFSGMSRKGSRFLVARVTTPAPMGRVLLFEGEGGPVPLRWDPDWTWNGADFVARHLEGMDSATRAIEVLFTTPIDLRERNQPVRRLEFQHLFRSLLRNAAIHARHHGDGPLEVDFRGLKAAADKVLKVRDQTREARVVHSSRRQWEASGEQRAVGVEARQGSLLFEGDMAPFLPYLVLGLATHAGKGRSMGFGGMTWRPVG